MNHSPLHRTFVKVLWLLVVSGVAWLVLIAEPAPAHEANGVAVNVVIERVRALDCFDPGLFGCSSGPEFYAIVSIGGHKFRSPSGARNRGDISPKNWQFAEDVAAFLESGVVPIAIDIFDRDGGTRGKDDHAALGPGGRTLNLDVNIQSCVLGTSGDGITGDVNGRCGDTLRSRGRGDDSAEIFFRVEMDILDRLRFESLSKTCSSQIAVEESFERLASVITDYESPPTPPFWEAYAVSGSDSADCSNWQYVEIANPLGKHLEITPSTTLLPLAQADIGNCVHSHLTYSVFGGRSIRVPGFEVPFEVWTYIGGGGLVGKWTGVSCEGPTVNPGNDQGNTETFHKKFGFLWGTDQVEIINNLYDRIVVALQALSHWGAGCGELGCYHQVKVHVAGNE